MKTLYPPHTDELQQSLSGETQKTSNHVRQDRALQGAHSDRPVRACSAVGPTALPVTSPAGRRCGSNGMQAGCLSVAWACGRWGWLLMAAMASNLAVSEGMCRCLAFGAQHTCLLACLDPPR